MNYVSGMDEKNARTYVFEYLLDFTYCKWRFLLSDKISEITIWTVLNDYTEIKGVDFNVNKLMFILNNVCMV